MIHVAYCLTVSVVRGTIERSGWWLSEATKQTEGSPTDFSCSRSDNIDNIHTSPFLAFSFLITAFSKYVQQNNPYCFHLGGCSCYLLDCRDAQVALGFLRARAYGKAHTLTVALARSCKLAWTTS